MTLWSKVFSSHIDKIVKCAVMRYFWRVLVAKGALAAADLPIRISKWIDTSLSDCVFIDVQKRRFSHHHLVQCPWYLDGDERV